MAMDIFAGNNLSVEIGTHTGTSAVATDFVEVPWVAEFLTSGFESTVIDVKTFNNNGYNRKLVGTKSISDLDLKVNWIPDNATHQKLEALAEQQKRLQVKITYFEDATRTTGYFITYVCFVASTSLEGDQDQVLVKTFTLAVDGGPILVGLLPSSTK